MSAPLSIVIPTLDAAKELPATLAPLVEGVAAGLVRELIVSDGGSRDDTRQIAEAAGAVVVTGSPGRGQQVRRGVAVARAEWLLIMHADSHLPEGWPAVVQTGMNDPQRAHAFRLGFRATGFAPRWVACWANLRSRSLQLPYGDQGVLISAALLEAVGGYPDLPLMEDVALARALRGRIGLFPATISTNAERYEAEGWLRRGARNLGFLARYLAGADPAALARGYAADPDAVSRSRSRN